MAEVANNANAPLDRDSFLKLAKYSLIKMSDMNEEMRNEAVEICSAAVEKYSTNNEQAARMIKENMDKKFGAPWHCITGEYFAFEITYEVKNILYLFTGGQVATLLWK